MPVFKNYDANGKLINTTTEPLTENNFERFISSYGEEKARIYFEAFAEFTDQLENIVYTKIEGNYFSNSLAKARRMVTELYNHNFSVVESGKKLIYKEPPTVNSDTSLQP